VKWSGLLNLIVCFHPVPAWQAADYPRKLQNFFIYLGPLRLHLLPFQSPYRKHRQTRAAAHERMYRRHLSFY